MIRSRVVAVPLAVLALGGVGVVAFGAAGDDSVRYRTVAAAVGDVEQTLSLTGVIEPSGRSDLSFGASGTVSRVRVEQGDEVDEGDVIAVLDRAALRAEVDRATADLADARAQLVDDREAQSSVVASAATSSSASPSSASTSTRGSGSSTGSGGAGSGGGSGAAGGSTAAVLAQLSEQQDAVLGAQTAATTALDAASTALAAQQAACADPAATEVDAGATERSEGTESTEAPSAAVLSEECTAALTAVQTAQGAASDAQRGLQTALETLGETLGRALSTLSTPSTPSIPSSSTGGTATPSTGSAPSTSSGSDSGTSSMTRTVTAATLAADQATIDSARAALLAAKAELAGAVVRAPAGGTVASLSVEQGTAVSAGDAVAIIVAPGLTTVSVDVTQSQAEQLEVGTAVTVTPVGADEELTGLISRINHTATESASGSDPTYGIEIVLDDRDLTIPDGMPASVSIVVGSASDVVTVPASAVTNGTVTVLDGSDIGTVRVTTGIVGGTRIEIADGLDAGDEVVLADLDAEVATGDSAQTGPGGFGGGITGGFSGGGFSGGPPSGGMAPR